MLDAQRQLYSSVRNYNDARYDYILNNLRLKQAAGTLAPSDLEALSSFLKPDYDPDRDFLPQDLAKTRKRSSRATRTSEPLAKKTPHMRGFCTGKWPIPCLATALPNTADALSSVRLTGRGFVVSVLFSLLRSRLLRPVFIALGLAMLVQVGLAVWLTRATVDGLVNDLTQRLGGESQRLAAELGSAEKEMSAGLAALSSNTRERLSGGLTGQLKDEQAQLREVLEENLQAVRQLHGPAAGRCGAQVHLGQRCPGADRADPHRSA